MRGGLNTTWFNNLRAITTRYYVTGSNVVSTEISVKSYIYILYISELLMVDGLETNCALTRWGVDLGSNYTSVAAVSIIYMCRENAINLHYHALRIVKIMGI